MNHPSKRAIIKHLLGSGLFAGIDASSLEKLSPPPEWISIRGGERILEQGQAASYYYMLVHGRLRVSVVGERGLERRVGSVSAGEGVGEMSLISQRAVSANVTAQRDSDLIRFSKAAFDDLIRTMPEAALNIARNIIDRLDMTLRGVRETKDLSTIVLVAASPSVDLDKVSNHFEAALALLGTVGVIGEGPLEAGGFGAFLHAQEDLYDHVILLCPRGSGEWRELCVRQGDQVLIVGNVDDVPAESPEPRFPSPANVDLVLLHGKEFSRGSVSKGWRNRFGFQNVHHLRVDEAADYQRLARILTGRANNLILSGGAAYSFAQIGVIRALEEASIPIDRVCGTSMGSLIAAQYSLGLSFAEMVERNRQIWADGKPLSDITFPSIAIVRGRRLQGLIRDALGEQEIEDMPIAFSCVSTNLTRAQREFHRRGSLWRAVRASGTIPGIGPPMIVDGDLLIDGGILSNLPVDIFKQHYTGNVICVDVGQRDMAPVSPEWNDRVDSGWSLLWRRVNPFGSGEKLPTIVDILYRTATLGSASSAQEAKRADLYFSLDLSQHNAFDFRLIERIAEAGYEHAKRQLETSNLSAISMGPG